MATPNFRTQKNFSLWVIDDEKAEDFFLMDEIERSVDELNSTLKYYRIELRSGYYTGVQLYVDRQGDDTELPTDYTATEWRKARRGYLGEYYNENSHSHAVRRELAERRKIEKWMNRTAQKMGFEQLYCVAIFSNGEAVYNRMGA